MIYFPSDFFSVHVSSPAVTEVSISCLYEPNWKFLLVRKNIFNKINRKKTFYFIIYDMAMGLTVIFHSLLIYDLEVYPSTSQSPRYSVCDSFLFFCILNISKYHRSESSFMLFNCDMCFFAIVLCFVYSL